MTKRYFTKNIVTAYVACALFISSFCLILNSSVVYAAIAPFQANDFCKQNGFGHPDCVKENKSGRQGTISCPEGKVIQNVYVHAGNGQTVYQLPHEGFTFAFSNNNRTVTVVATTHQQDLSWLGVTCTASTATPTPTPTATPTPTPTATPTPTPTPTATPTPTPGTQSKETFIDLHVPCDGADFEVVVRVVENGKAIKDVTVTFEYEKEKKTAKTNIDGIAAVSYARRGESDVNVDPAGFPTSYKKVTFPKNCSTPDIGGRSQVLGANTELNSYANTGSAMNTLMQGVGGLSLISLTAGSFLYAKTRKA